MTEIIEEPMRELMLTMSAWMRLKQKAKELEDNHNLVGTVLFCYMGKAWSEAEKDLKEQEKKLKKQIKEEKE